MEVKARSVLVVGALAAILGAGVMVCGVGPTAPGPGPLPQPSNARGAAALTPAPADAPAQEVAFDSVAVQTSHLAWRRAQDPGSTRLACAPCPDCRTCAAVGVPPGRFRSERGADGVRWFTSTPDGAALCRTDESGWHAFRWSTGADGVRRCTPDDEEPYEVTLAVTHHQGADLADPLTVFIPGEDGLFELGRLPNGAVLRVPLRGVPLAVEVAAIEPSGSVVVSPAEVVDGPTTLAVTAVPLDATFEGRWPPPVTTRELADGVWSVATTEEMPFGTRSSYVLYAIQLEVHNVLETVDLVTERRWTSIAHWAPADEVP